MNVGEARVTGVCNHEGSKRREGTKVSAPGSLVGRQRLPEKKSD